MVAVGRLRPPFLDDVQHYEKLLARYARLELIEVPDDEQVSRRLPRRSFTSLLHRDGETMDSVALSAFLERRRLSGQDLCFVIGGPFGLELRRSTIASRSVRSRSRTSWRVWSSWSSSTGAIRSWRESPTTTDH